jgi:predicted secreted hydrolase
MKRAEALLACLLLAGVAGVAGAAQLRLDAVLGAVEDAGFARAEAVRAFRFPEDHGPHPRYRSEWWYLTVNARNAAGEEFGVQFTVFRQGTRSAPPGDNPWEPDQLYLAHFAVTDVARGRHRATERLARGHPGLAGARADPFAVWVDGFSLTAPGGSLDAMRLEAVTADAGVALRLDPLKPIVLQGDRGLSAKGPAQASYYYSLTRLAVTGELVLDGVAHAIEGHGWFDREWSTSLLSEGQVGWDWFGLQFDAGEELMAFQLRRTDGRRDPFDQGVWVARDGTSLALPAAAFRLEPLRYWRDPAGVSWPVEWRLMVTLPQGARTLRVVAAIDDQRMDTLLVYWEGLVWILDERDRQIGAGYMELTGYE